MLKKHTIFSTGKKVDTFTVTFNSNGGTAVPPATTIVPGRLVPHPVDPTREGFNFVAWYKEPTLINDWDFSTDTMPAIDVTLYARWETLYTITFNTNGGTHVDPIIEEAETIVTQPANPTKEGNTFDGWYLDIQLTQPYTFSTMPENNISLYAKWNIVQYTVSFNSNSGTSVNSITGNFGTIISEPIAPTKSTNDFDAWYKESALINPWNFATDTIPVNGITLYAKWIPKGEIAYTTPGTYSWTAPAGVTSVSVVAVGGGGGGAWNTFAPGGGGGGGLGWKNNIPVIPGQNYTIVVGVGGTRDTDPSLYINSPPDLPTDGGASYFINLNTVSGRGGRCQRYTILSGGGVSFSGSEGGTFTGDGGGNGGLGDGGSNAGGAGGAGGYTSKGGDAQTVSASNASTSGGGHGGWSGATNRSPSKVGGNGGGVGIYGQGINGISTGVGLDGGAGSGGNTTNIQNSPYTTLYGGGGKSSANTNFQPANGGNGAVRIVWGKSRAFPLTNVGLTT
jgi:uncharacterized repeat protein (TIGR02543 family)